MTTAEDSADTRAALKKPNPAKFDSYDAYLDAFVTAEDLQYLDRDTARQIHQHQPPEHQIVITRAAFDASKNQAQAEAEAALAALRLASEGCDVSGNVLLKALAEREAAVKAGSLATIVFLRDSKGGKQEVSAFIDFKARHAQLRLDSGPGMRAVFQGKQRLVPSRGDLCYYSWGMQSVTCHSSPNFRVREDLQRLGFEHQQDHKVLMLDSAQTSADNCRCTELACTDYDQAIIFDHDVRRT